MNVVLHFLAFGNICFVVHFTTLSVDMCFYVMTMAGLMNSELEIFVRKLL